MKDFLKTRRRKTAAELGERKNPHGVSDTVREKERERERERRRGLQYDSAYQLLPPKVTSPQIYKSLGDIFFSTLHAPRRNGNAVWPCR